MGGGGFGPGPRTLAALANKHALTGSQDFYGSSARHPQTRRE